MRATRHNGFTVDLARASRHQPSRQQLRAMSRRMDAELAAAIERNPGKKPWHKRLTTGQKLLIGWITPGLFPPGPFG